LSGEELRSQGVALALTSRQLAALGEVAARFEGDGIEYWLFGGWAVDFYGGRITRDHDDVDLAIWRADLPRITELLQRDGWSHAPEPDEDGGTGYERNGVRLELTYLVRNEAGAVCIPLRSGLVPWPDLTRSPETAELNGVRARLIALESVARGKSRGREDPAEAAKDAADTDVLARLLR
jgi:Uncharacterised nucleotidyltransferase